MASATRVLLVTNNPRWEGVEAQVASVAEAFRNHPDFAMYAAVFRPGVLVERLERLGVPVKVLGVRGRFDVKAVGRLASLMRGWRIDVVHSHGYKANVMGALAARRAGVRGIVRTIHGLPEPFRGSRRAKMAFYLWLDGLVGRYLTDAIIAVSRDVAAYAGHRWPGVPVFTIPNGIDSAGAPHIARRQARRGLGLPSDAPAVGIVGRLVPIKDHMTFLAAARQIAQADPAVEFVIAGEGPLRDALEAEAAALGIRHRVHFHYIPGRAQQVLGALDVIVFSSRHEGIPYALLEALRSSVPVVATAVGGMGEALADGYDALLVPPNDPAALASATLRLLRDRKFARDLAARGRQTVEQRFSLDAMRDGMMEVYEYLECSLARRYGAVTCATELV